MNESVDKIKCTRCRIDLPVIRFNKNSRGNLYKTCNKCRQISRKYTQKRDRKCTHGTFKPHCKICKGSAICKHDRVKYICKECKGSQICEHGRQKHICKDCGGSQICQHKKEKRYCRECNGTAFCNHSKRKDYCKECKGSQVCEHGRQKRLCKECKGSAICGHNKVKYRCKECNNGNEFCEHDRVKYRCKICKGSQICQHEKRKYICEICNPTGYLQSIVRNKIYLSLKAKKCKSSIEYLGTNIDHFREHICNQFKEGMSWENYGSSWHIDHIIPIKYENPTLEEVIERLHYTNCQPLWKFENLKKGNRYIG